MNTFALSGLSADNVGSMGFFVKLGIGIVVVLVGTFLGFIQEAKEDFKNYQEKRRNRRT
jgi:hypothetical protein